MSWRFSCAPLALLTLAGGSVYAQSASIHGPVAGFIFSAASHTVRPILGVPGSLHIDAALLNNVDSAFIAPGGQWALTITAGQPAFVSGLADLAPAAVSTSGLINAIDNVVWSRDGSFALLYSSSGNQLQRVQLSATAASADSPIDLSSWGRAVALAIDPAGKQIAFGVTGSGIYRFTVGQSPALLSSIAQPAAAAFDSTGSYLYVIDQDSQQILQYPASGSGTTFASLAQPDGSPALSPTGLALSGDGRYLLFADRTTQSAFVYEIASQNLVNTIPLDFSPSRFSALSAGPAFLLNGDNPQEWLLVLDASQAPTVYFVPASQEEL